MPINEASFVRTETHEGRVIARVVCPHVGQREAPIIQSEIAEACRHNTHRVAIDFSEVTMLGSLGLGTLITLTKKCRENKGQLVIFGVDKPIVDLIKMSRLDRLLKICTDEPSALKALK